VPFTVSQPPPPAHPVKFGASLGPIPEGDPSIQAWITTMGRPLDVRHVFEGSTISQQPGWLAEAGKRRILADFDPAHDGSQATAFDAALSVYKQAGLDLDVTLWHAAPTKGFATPADLFAALAHYVPLLRKHGYRYIYDLNSWQAIHENQWQPWFPVDPAIKPDACGLEYYIQAYLGGQRLEACAAVAHALGVPFGLCELGANFGKYTEQQGIEFLTYVLNFCKAQVAAGHLEGVYDVVLWNDVVGNTAPGFPVTTQPASWLQLYREIAVAIGA
jgi:hypothetical protein